MGFVADSIVTECNSHAPLGDYILTLRARLGIDAIVSVFTRRTAENIFRNSAVYPSENVG